MDFGIKIRRTCSDGFWNITSWTTYLYTKVVSLNVINSCYHSLQTKTITNSEAQIRPNRQNFNKAKKTIEQLYFLFVGIEITWKENVITELLQGNGLGLLCWRFKLKLKLQTRKVSKKNKEKIIVWVLWYLQLIWYLMILGSSKLMGPKRDTLIAKAKVGCNGL